VTPAAAALLASKPNQTYRIYADAARKVEKGSKVNTEGKFPGGRMKKKKQGAKGKAKGGKKQVSKKKADVESSEEEEESEDEGEVEMA
jgi:hypothetical protein